MQNATDPKKQQIQARLTPEADAQSLIEKLYTLPRPAYLFEIDRKSDIVAFMDEQYDDWRSRSCKAAERFANMTLEDAKQPRAMASIATVGRAWWATDDPNYGSVFERLYRKTKTGDLFNWDSFAGAQGAVELPAHLMLLDCDGYSTDGRIAFLDHLFAVTESAWDEHTSQWSPLMLGPEGHNWYLHGIEAVPYVGQLFPELKRADFFLKTGWSVLEEHLRGNYHRDGGSRETTPGYHLGSMIHLWCLYWLAQRNNLPVSAQFEQRLLRATHFMIHLMTPTGAAPSFGDTGTKTPPFVTLMATAAAVSGDPLCKWAAERARQCDSSDTSKTAGQIPESAFWHVGLAGAERYTQAKAQPPQTRSVCLPDTGFTVMRESWDKNAAYMAINTAARGPIVTSHGHNDIFSFDLCASGTRFLGQLTIAPYGTSLGRDYDQATRAHNCLNVRGEEQIPIENEWRWNGCVLPRICRWDVHESLEFFHGVHEGFYRPKRQILHERKVVFIKQDQKDGADTMPGYWVIFDRVVSDTEETYDVWFHGCVPGSQEADSLLFHGADDVNLTISPPAGDELELSRDDSPEFHALCDEAKIDPTTNPAFAYSTTAMSCCFVWVLMPLQPGEQRPIVERLPVTMNGESAPVHDATAVRIQHRGLTDELCINHKNYDADLVAGDECHGWGQLILRRTASGKELKRVVRTANDCTDQLLP